MTDMEAIETIARKLLEGDAGSHGWDHAERVWRLCEFIGSREGANMEILKAAAFLHDIARGAEKAAGGRVCHAMAGAMQAGELLEELGVDPEITEQVVHCIGAHRYRGKENPPCSLEARVLFDADKLDALGAVGIGRAFLFAGEVGARLHNPDADIRNTRAYTADDTAFREFSVKLKDLKDRMLTPTGRKMATDRHAFMVEFFSRLDREVTGRQ